MNYQELFNELESMMLEKQIELAAIKAFLANEKLTTSERNEVELYSHKVWKELRILECRYDWHYSIAVESGQW